ncbi:hypothetical protein RirG_186060 [Rhizophagus irregularis DAOM 197198w]|uniref:Uncharacterized protein n=1 Tax=Rhizophagus irregularis (strain DAOM 197198w) TaxID=1432141 RepID=A0A015JXF3_RHIIW|nr:hypothetical protein RirG_186060 [Rhizophagus irregularis DAOM 197198w]
MRFYGYVKNIDLDIGPISTVNPPEPLIIPPDSSESMNQMEHKDQMDNKPILMAEN